jgi:outer membrane protein assembly factor BamA
VHGFGVAIGSMVPGSGFAFGPRYTNRDLLDGRVILRVESRATINESYGGRLDLSIPHLVGDWGFLDFSVAQRNISEMPYYGSGPDSEKTGRSNFRLEDVNVELRPGVQIYKRLRASLIGSYLGVNIGPGHATRYISAEKQYSPDAAPGIDRQTSFWRGGGLLEYDWRDRASSPSSGGRYSAQYVRYQDRYLGQFSFYRLDLDAAQYLPLLNQTRVITLHGSSSLTDTNGTQRVPFYLQPTMGGPTTLRGYRFNRFYGDNSVMLNAEYRWEISPTLDLAAFVDAGKVFNHWEQWNLHNLESDVGFGLRFKGRGGRVVFNFDTGFSHEGFQVWFRVNNLL